MGCVCARKEPKPVRCAVSTLRPLSVWRRNVTRIPLFSTEENAFASSGYAHSSFRRPLSNRHLRRPSCRPSRRPPCPFGEKSRLSRRPSRRRHPRRPSRRRLCLAHGVPMTSPASSLVFGVEPTMDASIALLAIFAALADAPRIADRRYVALRARRGHRRWTAPHVAHISGQSTLRRVPVDFVSTLT